MPTKNLMTAFNKILIRSLRMFLFRMFSIFLEKIPFGLDGIPLLMGRIICGAISGVGYALMGEFQCKVKTYLTIEHLYLHFYV
jgi:hypothetical protein